MAAPQSYDVVFAQGEDDYHFFRAMIACDPAATWTQNTPYLVGDYVIKKTSPDGSVFMCVVAGTAHASTEPTWPTVKGGRVTDNTVTWMRVDTTRLLDTTGYTAEFAVKAESDDTTNLLDGTTANSRVEVGYSPAKWVANTAYGAGQQVVPTTLNGYVYQVEAAGTSHATTEPIWPVPATAGVFGQTIVDNTVTWRLVRTDAYVSNVRIALTPIYTNGLADWGAGVWQLDLIDTFSTRETLLVGNAYFVLKGSA